MSKNEAVYIGLDIGTTSISLGIISADGNVRECRNVPSESAIASDRPFHKIQSVERIIEKAVALVDTAVGRYSNIAAIGLTGQMHGILYADGEGKAVSDLYTWQDKSGDELTDGGETYCKHIERVSGEKTATGYGLVTHFYLMKNNLIPENARKMCTIMDYAAMILTKRKSPLTHLSNAAAFGIFSCDSGDFNRDALDVLGIDTSILPEITGENSIIGSHSCTGQLARIPIAVAVGDNQASFIGTVDDAENSVLVNIGTGSQVSMLSNGSALHDGFELRPFIGGTHLKSYSALCGGHAYVILQRFMRDIAREITGKDEEQYALMDKIAEGKTDGGGIKVTTTFNGTRQSPDKAGSIENVTGENFSPSNLIYGFSEGIVNELYEKCADTEELKRAKFVTVSGNGARKNGLIPRIIETKFGRDVVMKEVEEEAAVGAAIFAAKCVKQGEGKHEIYKRT